ncbi:MAG: hypothetical protein ONB16_05810, partial [candidate division KSB1 bacterium]|nr:hypothetical protein [candidate division KSB1 bacterium]
MILSDALKKIERIEYATTCRPVVKTVAEAIQRQFATKAQLTPLNHPTAAKNHVLRISIADEKFGPPIAMPDSSENDWMFFQLDEAGNGELVTSKPHLLYGLFCRIVDDFQHLDVQQFQHGWSARTTFNWQRSLMD